VLVRATRWFLICAPVVAGILVLSFGTAGGISTAFGIVLIGIGPIVWMWNWLVRMSFEESDRIPAPTRDEQDREPRCPQPPAAGDPGSIHPRKKLARTPRRPS
jgi:hypothetical protein